tara:strand:+ start:139 stop:375 length:237 start_codon:yes stop_codon:yes gene_type:complete
MKLLNKIKNIIFPPPKKRTGNIVVYLLDTTRGRVYEQHIYSIGIYDNRKVMLKYLDSTLMTTSASHIRLLDYAELKND